MLNNIGFILVFLFFVVPVSAEIAVVPRTEEKAFCPAKQSENQSQDAAEQYTKIAVVVYESPTPTQTLTIEPIQAASLADSAPTVKPASLNSDAIFELINNYRSTLGLPAFQKEEKLCSLARGRGPELYDEIFVTGNIHGGFYARNIPFWITENMKYGSSEQEVFDWWLGSAIHRKAIEGNFQYSCGECYGNSCAQLFTSYVAK